MARKSSTPKTMKLIREWGWYFWSVESYNAFSGQKKDLFGIIDLVAITPCSTIGIQSCGGDFSEHERKLCIYDQDRTAQWLSSPDRKLILIGWRMIRRFPGKKAKIYKPRVAWIYIEDGKLIFEEKETDFYGRDEKPRCF